MSTRKSKKELVENRLDRVQHLAKNILDKKGDNVVIFDVRNISPITDFFVIAEGLSEIHNRAIAEYLTGTEKPDHTEGLESGTWVLIDYIDIIVHIFTKETRSFYGLERLWGDAPQLEVGSQA